MVGSTRRMRRKELASSSPRTACGPVADDMTMAVFVSEVKARGADYMYRVLLYSLEPECSEGLLA